MHPCGGAGGAGAGAQQESMRVMLTVYTMGSTASRSFRSSHNLTGGPTSGTS